MSGKARGTGFPAQNEINYLFGNESGWIVNNSWAGSRKKVQFI